MIKIINNSLTKHHIISNRISQYISVYQGISPALLATMSLSQGVKGNSNDQLITSLVKNNIIRNKILQQAMRKYDRKQFVQNTKHINNNKVNYYENRPYKISGGQNMTDIFTHAVVLQQIVNHLQNQIKSGQKHKNIKIIDIGTGHGYLSFVLASILHSLGINKNLYLIQGIDSSAHTISFANSLKQEYLTNKKYQELKCVQFREQTIQHVLQGSQCYDVIIGGFYMPQKFSQGLVKKLNKNINSYGIWPQDSSSGQSLYSINNTRQMVEGVMQAKKTQIMSTMFSMPTIKTSVSQFFHDQNVELNQSQSSQKQAPSQADQAKVREHVQLLKKQIKQKQKQDLKEQLKSLITKHTKQLNMKMGLKQMKNIPQINDILEKLNKK